jgi:hypothetical protein
MLIRLPLTALLCLLPLAAGGAAPSRIIILRHGEKADAGAAAFLAITLHTLELAAPAAAAWERPLTL